jgi:hypothetical protein
MAGRLFSSMAWKRSSDRSRQVHQIFFFLPEQPNHHRVYFCDVAGAVVLRSIHPQSNAVPGGSGLTFHWDRTRAIVGMMAGYTQVVIAGGF